MLNYKIWVSNRQVCFTQGTTKFIESLSPHENELMTDIFYGTFMGINPPISSILTRAYVYQQQVDTLYIYNPGQLARQAKTKHCPTGCPLIFRALFIKSRG